ncbi:DNA repair protein RadC [Nitrosococcus oceani ATCC 19707]|uniref:DNA repair protein RadC n=3 Tax=Nitrosococcus oceani TaxID=1229 RepID=Q3JDF2_NITOC|nr:JAB domain-containing protein [Nitrosococcus oceani]ABA57144.1 DNA repair protein RadC [Nitrosococcus oceani ATCC 19707]EDZ66560.1 DNA repair protein RadC [Nitrosococcus oceani AFC27]KFI20408.1 DNA repair protein RadC [Nitrosococcus oceani C-27]GEM19834.1 DNA repair protein RadC [Nitrosococcus oceani]
MASKSSPTQVIPKNRFARVRMASLNDPEKQSLLELAFAVLHDLHQPGVELPSPNHTRDFLRMLLAERKAEVFGCLYLDNRHRVIETVELFQGTIDGASVYPRVVVQQALSVNAAAVMFFHNHPSGVAEPSNADEAITRRLKEALALVDIRVLDHFVVTAGESISFAERGLL